MQYLTGCIGNVQQLNELQYSYDCWYDIYLFHNIPTIKNEIMIQCWDDFSLDQIKGVYLISEHPIKFKPFKRDLGI